MPLSRSRRAWERSLLDRTYAHDIAAAREAKNQEKVDSLISEHRLELDLHEEEEDAYFTKKTFARGAPFVDSNPAFVQRGREPV